MNEEALAMPEAHRIVASVLGVDYSRLGEEVSDLEQAGVAAIQ